MDHGVLQGDTLAPFLFIIVLDYALRRALGRPVLRELVRPARSRAPAESSWLPKRRKNRHDQVARQVASAIVEKFGVESLDESTAEAIRP